MHKQKDIRRCDYCKIDVHRASNAEHLRAKRLLKKLKQEDMFTPNWFFQESRGNINIIPRRTYNPEPFREIAIENVKIDNE